MRTPINLGQMRTPINFVFNCVRKDGKCTAIIMGVPNFHNYGCPQFSSPIFSNFLSRTFCLNRPFLKYRQVVRNLMPFSPICHKDMANRFHAGIIVEYAQGDDSNIATRINPGHL